MFHYSVDGTDGNIRIANDADEKPSHRSRATVSSNKVVNPEKRSSTRPRGSIFNFGKAASVSSELDNGGSESVEVREGNWLSEKALWLVWRHVGMVEAVAESEVVTIKSDGLCESFNAHPPIKNLAMEYAISVQEQMMRSTSNMVDDLSANLDDHGITVLCMNTQCRAIMSIPLLETIAQQQLGASVMKVVRGNGLKHLESETEQGQCTLVYDSIGRVRRVVSVVALELENQHGDVLVQLGKLQPSTGTITSSHCVLPGKKAQSAESPDETLKALLKETLGPLAEGIEITRTSVVVEDQASDTYSGLMTSYLRTVFHANLKPEHDYSGNKVIVPACDNQLEKMLGGRGAIVDNIKGTIAGFSVPKSLAQVVPVTCQKTWTQSTVGSVETGNSEEDAMKEVFVFRQAQKDRRSKEAPKAEETRDSRRFSKQQGSPQDDQPSIRLFTWMGHTRFNYFSSTQEGQADVKEFVHTLNFGDGERFRYGGCHHGLIQPVQEEGATSDPQC
jgi:hypothetical protein